uniref:50S ribosomal protein L35 n=1 Tax=Crouania attenuata TaxID=42002 RepID=A0A4D6WS27_9FLOR|nr:ribosomal protein L35 [Crouania attenuata]
MYKLKTNRSIKKRFKITSRGKFLRHKASHSHLLEKKGSKLKQKQRKCVVVMKQDIQNFCYGLPYD